MSWKPDEAELDAAEQALVDASGAPTRDGYFRPLAEGILTDAEQAKAPRGFKRVRALLPLHVEVGDPTAEMSPVVAALLAEGLTKEDLPARLRRAVKEAR